MHIGLIPDGNRRFMKKQGITNLSNSYSMGISRFHDFLNWCGKNDVKEVTIYALSLENIKNRSNTEINTLLKVFNKHAIEALDDDRIHENKIKIQICGDIDSIKELDNQAANEMLENLNRLVEKTKEYENLNLNVTIAYGGRQEIINATKKIVEAGEEISEENIQKNLWVSDYPELIIRTSESRLSNFLTWQSAYSEIYFVDKLWQEFTEEDFNKVLSNYTSRERRFGR